MKLSKESLKKCNIMEYMYSSEIKNFLIPREFLFFEPGCFNMKKGIIIFGNYFYKGRNKK